MIDTGFDSNAPYSGYPYRCVSISKHPNDIVLKHLEYTFRTPKRCYIVIIEKYPHEVYVLKFHISKLRGSKLKYHFQTDDQDAARVIATCCYILLKEIKFKNKNASFGFIGSPTILSKKEKAVKALTSVQKKRKERRDEFGENTRRFRIYSSLAKRVFHPDDFQHVVDINNSTYLILNRLNQETNLVAEIEKMFEEYYLREQPDIYPSSASIG